MVKSSLRRVLRGAAVATASVAVAGAMLTPASAAPAPIEYVALGDSAAAGPLIMPQDNSAIGCTRSLRNYPQVVAKSIGAKLIDVTCSSAKSSDVVSTQQKTFAETMPVQAKALSARTTLVTLTIGANDIGLFQIALSCANIPGSQPCSQKFRSGGTDQIFGKVNAAKSAWGALMDRIRAAAPNARVVVVGYGTYIRPTGCAAQPIRPADAVYLQHSLNTMNDAVAAQARKRGFTYVDITKLTVGHDICAPADKAYYVGLVPSSFGMPLHPTALGMNAIGRKVAGVVRAG